MTDNIEKTYKSICRICHGGCGVIVSVQNGKVVKVKGDPASPMNKGWMCIKGVMTPEIANHPDRLRTPLLRKGKRGGMQWESISWERALEEIARKLDALKKNTVRNRLHWDKEREDTITCMSCGSQMRWVRLTGMNLV